MSISDAAGVGAIRLRVMKSKIVTGADVATLETNLNDFYTEFNDAAARNKDARLVSVDPLSDLAVLITYTE